MVVADSLPYLPPSCSFIDLPVEPYGGSPSRFGGDLLSCPYYVNFVTVVG